MAKKRTAQKITQKDRSKSEEHGVYHPSSPSVAMPGFAGTRIGRIFGGAALRQLAAFREAVEVSGIVLAKLDSSARGGIVVAIQEEHGVPVKLVGVGEGLGDLETFDPDDERQDAGILQRARDAVDASNEEQRQTWRDEVVRECRAFFAPARLQQLAQPLMRVIEHLPRTQSMTVVPTDDRFGLVLRAAP